MAAGTARPERIRSGICNDTGGINKYLAVVADTTQEEVTIAGANARILGVTIEDTDTTGAPVQYAGGGVVLWQAAGVINRLTSSVPTRIVSAANGQCQALPTSAGTYWVVGEADQTHEATASAGDYACVLLYDAPIATTVSE